MTSQKWVFSDTWFHHLVSSVAAADGSKLVNVLRVHVYKLQLFKLCKISSKSLRVNRVGT